MDAMEEMAPKWPEADGRYLAPKPDITGPLEEYENVTSDGGVRKKVIQEGSGDELPPRHAPCLAHYVGRFAHNGEIFFDSRQETTAQEPMRLIAGRDSIMREAGLHITAAGMRKGEIAKVLVSDPKYGFGEMGNFSFPAVPPNCSLLYEVEMINWDNEYSEPQREQMLYEERLEAAERRRLAGNDLFKEGRYKEALAKYAVALSFLDEDFLMQLDGPFLDKAIDVKLPVHLNMAACQIKSGDYHTAIYNCNQVLSVDKDNAKALFRRGRARHLLGQTQEALEDLQAAYSKSQDDKSILKEIHSVRATIAEERKASAALFKGRLESTQGLGFKDEEPSPSPASAPHQQLEASRDPGDPSGDGYSGDPEDGKWNGLMWWLDCCGLLSMAFAGRAPVSAARKKQ